MIGEVARQIRNVTTLRAYSLSVFMREVALFPYDYLLRRGKSSSLMNAAIFTTLRCNLRCRFCNIIDLLEQSRDYEDPSFETLSRWFDEFAPYKPNIILFGGEPLVRKDLTDLLQAVKGRGMRCGIFTNGMLVNEERASALMKNGMDYVVFSIHGVEDVHNEACRSKVAYARAERGLAAFDRPGRGTRVAVNCVIGEENLDTLEELVELGERYNVDAIRFGHRMFYTPSDLEAHQRSAAAVFPGEDVPGVNWIQDIDAETTARYVEAVRRIKALKHPKVFFSPELSDHELEGWYSARFESKRRCMFVWRGMFVYPNGDVVPCESLGRVMGNLNESSLGEIWNGDRYIGLRGVLKEGLLPGCARCCKL